MQYTMDTPLEHHLRVFVYGTLMTGQANHDTFAPGIAATARAWTAGRLTTMPEGYPMLFAPLEAVLAHARGPVRIDLATQRAAALPAFTEDSFGSAWGMIAGEVLYFADPAAWLPTLDALEDFSPGLPSLYCRVLLPVVARTPRGALACACWAYASPRCAPLP